MVHEDIDAAEGTERLVALMKEPPIWSLWWRALFAGCRTALMCMMGFKGSILDAVRSLFPSRQQDLHR